MAEKPKNEIVKGDVAGYIEWKTGKGYFLSLVDDDIDYYGYGRKDLKEGERVELEVQQGTGNFKDKKEVKSVAVLESKAAPAGEPSDRKAPGPLDVDRGKAINAAVALKCAEDFVAQKKITTEDYADCICQLADRFFDWLNEKGEK